MRVLILSQYFWPETFRINEVAQSLRAAGCEVTVLTGQPNYPGGRTFPGYRALSTRRELYQGIEVLRVPLLPRGRGSAIGLAANYLSFVLATSLFGPWMLRGRRFDVIFVYAISPILQAIGGMVLRRTTGGALVPWVQDLWPQSLEVTGFVRSRWLLRRVAAVVRWIYRRSDLLLLQSRGFASYVTGMAGATPVDYHPNPGELAFQAPVAGVAAMTLEPGFNLLFAGNLGSAQSLDTLLDAAELLRDLPDVKLVLVGDGSRAEWVRQECARRSLANVSLPGRFPPEAIPGIMGQASALLVSLKRDPIMAQTIPSKVQTYLAAGRPIIASLEGEGARVVEEARAGVSCPPQDGAALAAAVRRLRALPGAERDAMGARGREYYARNFDPAMLAARLRERFELLAAQRRAAAGAVQNG
jgi:glycosyltransferase involved in cell wall biosynthesis